MTEKAIISLRLPAHLKSRWVLHCRSNGQSPSDAMRNVIQHLTRSSDETSHFEVDSQVPDATRARVELRMTESEHSAATRIAEQAGISTNRWIADLVRAYITRQPQFGMHELQMIGESNTQLRAIGRNLNQIALAMNRSGHGDEVSDLIARLNEKINEHTEMTNSIIRSNLDRWSITWP